MDIDFGVGFSVESFVCLEGDKDSVSYSVSFENNLCRVDFRNASFDVVYHFYLFVFNVPTSELSIFCTSCKFMILICKRKHKNC